MTQAVPEDISTQYRLYGHRYAFRYLDLHRFIHAFVEFPVHRLAMPILDNVPSFELYSLPTYRITWVNSGLLFSSLYWMTKMVAVCSLPSLPFEVTVNLYSTPSSKGRLPTVTGVPNGNL